MYSHQVCFCGWVSHGLRIYSLGGNDQSGMGHRERKWLETREAAGFNSVSAPFLIPFLQESLWAACQGSFSTAVMHSLVSCLWLWSLRATWAVLSLVRVCVGTVTALSTSSSSSAKKLCFLASHITPPMTFWSILHISTVLITVLVFFSWITSDCHDWGNVEQNLPSANTCLIWPDDRGMGYQLLPIPVKWVGWGWIILSRIVPQQLFEIAL